MATKKWLTLACSLLIITVLCAFTSVSSVANPDSQKIVFDATSSEDYRSEWWMRGHDPQHTGRSPFVGPNTSTKKWEFTTGKVSCSPTIGSDGTIYVFAGDHYVSPKLYAINPDGTKKWDFAAMGLAESSPAIGSDGTIYIGSYDRKLYAINPNGTKKWEFITGGIIYSSPVIDSDGIIYVGSDDYKLYAINPNGTKKWDFATGGGVNSSPAIGFDGTIYVGSGDKKLYAINPDGTMKWTFLTGDYIFSSPAIGVDGTIYVGSFDKKLYAINPDGTKQWDFATGSGVYSSPAIGSDGTIYVGSHDYKLYAINSNGTKKWDFVTGSYVVPSPIIGFDGTIYVGSYDRKLYAINPDGTVKWSFITGDYIYASATIGSDGTIYVGSWDNKLYAIGPPNVTDITPGSALRTDSVNTSIAGIGFMSGATVKLTKSGESDIAATGVTVVSQTRITCSFDLTGQALGAWDVVVTNPDEQSGTLSDGFIVSEPFILSATVKLGDYFGTGEGIPVRIQLYHNGAVVRTVNTTLDANGKFFIPDVPSDTYYVAIKPSHWLQKVTGPVTVDNVDTDFVIR